MVLHSDCTVSVVYVVAVASTLGTVDDVIAASSRAARYEVTTMQQLHGVIEFQVNVGVFLIHVFVVAVMLYRM